MKKTKVLFIDEGLSFGGSFIVAARLACHLDPEKYQSFIVSSTELEDIKHHVNDSVKLFFLRKALTYKNRMEFDGRIRRLSGGNIINKFIKKLCIYAYSAVEYVANSVYCLKICALILKYNIDIVHGNNAKEAITCAKLLKRKIVWHIHGEGRYSPREMSKYFQGVDKYVSISQYSTQHAITSGVPSRDIVTLHNPTGETPISLSSDRKAELRRTLGISEKTLVLGVFGRLVEWKGQLEFLKASLLVLEKGYDIALLLVGSDGENFGSYTATLKEFAENKIGLDRVKFTGYVKNTNDYYQLCDIVVHSSIEPEPFGLVIIEAMKNGVAIIASTKGAGPELVNHGVTGLIADPTNSIELSQAILTLIDDKVVREQYAAAAKLMVDENMNPIVFAKKMEKIYEEVMK